jgi:hypothetical protein
MKKHKNNFSDNILNYWQEQIASDESETDLQPQQNICTA